MRNGRSAFSIDKEQGVDTVMRKNVWRAVIEAGFIIFLFYSNLLMGEFERSGMGQKRGLIWAIGDVLPFPILNCHGSRPHRLHLF
jgi:hypothetical protein